MLKPLYRYRTSCCSHDWQYSLASRIFPCRFCGSRRGEYASLPCEISPPIENAHTPALWNNPVRVAFITAHRGQGFLNFAVGDELHCGLPKTDGCVVSYSPKEQRFRHDRARFWEQAIVCDLPAINGVDAIQWDRVIDNESVVVTDSGFDCLDFATRVLNAISSEEFTREKLGEIMCKKLYHVLNHAELQRSASRNVMP